MPGQVVLDEKIIGFELSAHKKQYKWTSDTNKRKRDDNDQNEEDDDSECEIPTLQRYLLIHSAVIGVGAKADQRNLIHLKVTEGDKVVLDQPILALTLNKNDSLNNLGFRIHIYETTEVTFKLIEGDGPIFVMTSKILEPPFDLSTYSSDDDLDETSSILDDFNEEENGNNRAGGDDNKVSKQSKQNKTKKTKQQPTPSSATQSSTITPAETQKKKRKKKSDDE
ncbi:unnamed protein product [Didymodactylos carnosus]|uniref:Nucleoplasmin core domain-containing protein n=1 Tax=Didymodactylos carnosus TaxID=1234261 RepID=A0A814EM68_9BILA|nr:unnamed protein product [Didymodactylos carnosus]CAF1121002.1 unnamed protein product [Didymodactylos carnosus]CAF3744409.1 unnamed protein product [Didymodactylos carnosus]CAF3895048.1 unnamed protein product [Didymodactylos carnosus]